MYRSPDIVPANPTWFVSELLINHCFIGMILGIAAPGMADA